ncbi:MAG: hypothetical protein MUQ27_11040 [Acidimicrobiia bacterium]|nr:hypothetical protein [Acidimicrobiia bacterium]
MNQNLEAEISTACRCCDRPLQLTVRSDLSYRVVTEGAEPVISVPSVDFSKFEDPSIIHGF